MPSLSGLPRLAFEGDTLAWATLKDFEGGERWDGLARVAGFTFFALKAASLPLR